MKKGIAVVILVIASLPGCTLRNRSHVADYNRDYVYAVRNVLNAPNWDDSTYPGYSWGSYPWYGSNSGM